MLVQAVIRGASIGAILMLVALAVTTSSATVSSSQSATAKSARETSVPNGPLKDVEFSYYDTLNLMGSCGTRITDFDLIVALSTEQYGNGEHCNKKIVINVDGKSQTGTVADKCVSCPSKQLWMPPSLFGLLAGVGDNVDFSDLSRKTHIRVLTGEWSFANDGGEQDSSDGSGVMSRTLASSTTLSPRAPQSSPTLAPGAENSPTLAPGAENSPTLAPGAENSPTLPAGVTSSQTAAPSTSAGDEECTCE